MATITKVSEGKRGCGYRKGGGLYLVAPAPNMPCGRLPIPLVTCPTCGAGFKHSRQPAWVDSDELKWAAPPCSTVGLLTTAHAVCPLNDKVETGRALLVWVGEAHYPTAQSFLMEAASMGISRRIQAVPNDFVVGETWCMLAHRRAFKERCPDCNGTRRVVDEAGEWDKCTGCPDGWAYTAGVITFFRPQAVEYVVKGTETEEELDALEARGLRLVDVERVEPCPVCGHLLPVDETGLQVHECPGLPMADAPADDPRALAQDPGQQAPEAGWPEVPAGGTPASNLEEDEQ
jgi:hypothetical protein